MANKRKHPRYSAAASSVDSATRSAQAASALRSSRYKEAIELYKDLLKSDSQPVWREGLAAAYAGRAKDLAAKGLVKEALAVWRTRAEACGAPMVDGPYVGWLIDAGEIEPALRLLTGASGLSPDAQAHLETQLARAALLAPDSALTGLAADSPLRRHRVAVLAAFSALESGDDAALDAQLQAIPFRSPYRDLRPTLKALACCNSDVKQAGAALARVPHDSPFESLAAAVRGCVLPGPQGVGTLRGLTEEGRALVLDVQGCPGEQRALVSELAKLDPGPVAAATLYDVLERYRRALPDGAASRLCRLLLPHAPERLKAYKGSFGALPEIEYERTLALAAELKLRLEQAEDHWLRVVQLLTADPSGHLPAAHVLRHLAEHIHHCARDGHPCPAVLDWWAQSLELDPADRETHLKLIRAARAQSDAKETRARLDAALERFPEDTEVLLEAVEAALASGAFKKAAGIAKRVLELDPINPRVRSVIGHAHLSHARKQIVAHNAAAARRELEQAAQWVRAASDHGSIKLLRGLIAEPAADGDALLRAGLADLGGGLVGSFLLLLEGWRTKHDPKVLLHRAGADVASTPNSDQVVALAHALNAAHDDDKALRGALGPLRALLMRAAAAQFAESDLRLVCEALHRRTEGALTRHFAGAALKRWPGRPVFVYLQAAAAHADNPWQMTQREIRALERALDEARAGGDERTALRLSDLLTAATGGLGLPADVLDDELDRLVGGGGGARAMAEAVLAMGGEDQFLDLMRKQLGKATFEELRRAIGGSKKRFASALMDVLAGAELPGGPGGPTAHAGVPPPPAVPQHSKRPVGQRGQKDLFDE